MVARGGRAGTGATAGAGGGQVVRRRPGRGSTGQGGSRLKDSVMSFYTDDSPGIKIAPHVVIIGSLGFIAIVTLLHIVGKLRG